MRAGNCISRPPAQGIFGAVVWESVIRIACAWLPLVRAGLSRVIDSKAGWTENASMKLELPLAEMSLAEKLAAMEALWADLARHAGELASPEWHAEILKERGRCLAAGEEEVLDWEEAKRRLRQEIHEG